MCGIAGLFHYDGRRRPGHVESRDAATFADVEVMVGGTRRGVPTAAREDIDIALRMSASMIARGPDSAGLWQDESGSVLFAQRRLAIIDPGAGGFQPMVFDGGRLVANFNGEIYNYKALKAELEGRGRRFATNSDTEVLLQL